MKPKPSFFGAGELPAWDDGVVCFDLFKKVSAGTATPEECELHVLYLRRFILMRLKQQKLRRVIRSFQELGEQATDAVCDLASELWRKTRKLKLTYEEPLCLWAVYDTTLRRLICGMLRKLEKSKIDRTGDVFRYADSDPLDSQFEGLSMDSDIFEHFFNSLKSMEESVCADAIADASDRANPVRAAYRLMIRHLKQHRKRMTWGDLPGRLKAKISHEQHLLLQSRISSAIHLRLPDQLGAAA